MADNTDLAFSYALRLSLLLEEDKIAFAGAEVMDCALGEILIFPLIIIPSSSILLSKLVCLLEDFFELFIAVIVEDFISIFPIIYLYLFVY